MAAIASDMARLVRILCAVALLCVGFAHKPAVLDAPAHRPELASFALPDGSIPDLCLPGHDDEGKHGSHDLGRDCEACRITASVALPTPADTVGQPVVMSAEIVLPIRREAFYRQLFPPNATPRGPPAGILA